MARKNVKVRRVGGIVPASTGVSGAVASALAGTAGASAVNPGAGYDLAAAIAAVPFTVNLPTEPTTSGDPVVCSTAQQIIDALAVDGQHTIIATGTYSTGSISIGGSDKLIECQSGVTLNLGGGSLSFSGATRVKFEGGTVNTSTSAYIVQIPAASDIHIKGTVFRNAGATGQGIICNQFAGGVSRVALEGIDIESLESVCYPISVVDFVIANSRLYSLQPNSGGNGWAIRHDGNMTRAVYIDSYFRSINNTVMRHGYGGGLTYTDYYLARNQVEAGAGQCWAAESGSTFVNTWFIDNGFYSVPPNGLWLIRLQGSDPAPVVTYTNLTATGNEGYSPDPLASFWFDDAAANPLTTTDGYLTPPTWEMQ